MLIQINSAPFTNSASNWIEVYTLTRGEHGKLDAQIGLAANWIGSISFSAETHACWVITTKLWCILLHPMPFVLWI